MNERSSGILLHVSSLPSPYGVGDLGPEAYRFVDFLESSGQKYWQILPLSPTSPVFGNSPYSSYSAFAGNPLLISPDFLLKEKLISRTDIKKESFKDEDKVDYERVTEAKYRIFRKAFDQSNHLIVKKDLYKFFCRQTSYWLDDYSLFLALKDYFQGKPWNEWEKGLRDRHPEALEEAHARLEKSILFEKFLQYLFYHQWSDLRRYCRKKKIKIIGDLPMYVNYDSADVWAHPEYFKLDRNKNPKFLSGVPPDYFSEEGQLWGTPVYQWSVLKKTKYAWWKARLSQNLKYYDVIRLDHFRGFVAYWQVPQGEKTAVKGKWVKAPAEDFFKSMRNFSIIAEDLGVITAKVRDILQQFGFPGMKVLQFAFSGNPRKNPYMPENHIPNAVLYTGTHDNNTIRGWFEQDASLEEKERFKNLMDEDSSAEAIHWQFIQLAMSSLCNTVIIPLQDILGLGEEARFNKPGTRENNWSWRYSQKALSRPIIEKLLKVTRENGR